MQKAPKKIALVTGANNGIGFEVARQLVASGNTVLAGGAEPGSWRGSGSVAANIVNVSNGLGSLTKSGDPVWTHVAAKYLGYAASKAAFNMLTVQLAYELRETSNKVNSAEPGYTATDLNQHRGTQTIPEGAVEIIRLAMLLDDGPTGTFRARKAYFPGNRNISSGRVTWTEE